jgi:hypothetical protein
MPLTARVFILVPARMAGLAPVAGTAAAGPGRAAVSV